MNRKDFLASLPQKTLRDKAKFLQLKESAAHRFFDRQPRNRYEEILLEAWTRLGRKERLAILDTFSH